MSLTPEQKAEGWIEWHGGDCPIKDDRTVHQVMDICDWISDPDTEAREWNWDNKVAYRIIEAHGADAAPARPTPFPADYSELVFDDAGWSQTIIVDGKRPEWLRDDDRITRYLEGEGYAATDRYCRDTQSIRVRRRERKRETVECGVSIFLPYPKAPVAGVSATIDLIDGQPDLSTLKIGENL